MLDPREAWAFLENSDLVSSADEVQVAIRRLAGEIEGELKDRYPLVLVVMGGAVVVAGQLLPLLRMPLDVDYIHVTRYGAASPAAASSGASSRRAACGVAPSSWSTTSWTAARPCAPSASG
jgi:hypoxanthine-guanine phosphoribosyltransferase